MNTKEDEDINKIQQYILKKLKNYMYGYTTLPSEQKLYILLELIINWIDHEMDMRDISGTDET